jgi:hypothetical protein
LNADKQLNCLLYQSYRRIVYRFLFNRRTAPSKTTIFDSKGTQVTGAVTVSSGYTLVPFDMLKFSWNFILNVVMHKAID